MLHASLALIVPVSVGLELGRVEAHAEHKVQNCGVSQPYKKKKNN